MLLQIFTTLLLFILLALIVLKSKYFNPEGLNRWTSLIMFSSKVAGGVLMGWYYINCASGGDTLLFFQQSQILTQLLLENPVEYLKVLTGLGDQSTLSGFYDNLRGWYTYDDLYNDSRTVIRLSSLIGLFSFGNYYFHALAFAFLSYTGCIGLFRFIKDNCDLNSKVVIAVVVLIPSCIFWTSGLGKESIVVFLTGTLLFSFNNLLKKKTSFIILLSIPTLIFLFFQIKVFLFILLIPPAIAFMLSGNKPFSGLMVNYLAIYGVFIGIAVICSFIFPKLDASEMIHQKRYNFESFVQAVPADAKSYIKLPDFEPSFLDLFKASPAALYTTFTRPGFKDSQGLESWVSFLENYGIIMVIAFSVFLINRRSLTNNRNLVFFCLMYVITNYILIGLTTPVLGAMVRYKSLLLPFLLMIPMLILSDKFSWLKNDTFEGHTK